MTCDDCPGGTDWEQRALDAEKVAEEAQEDVLRFITQRNLVCERLAAYIIPGPDGQDDIDRRRLIREVSEDAWDDVEGWQEMAAKGAAVIAERDLLRHVLAEYMAGNRIVDGYWYAPDENGEPHYRNHEATAEETALIDSLREEVGHDA